MIIELGKVPIKAALHACEMLQNVGAPLAGIVLNDKSENRKSRYGYYGKRYYSYGYGYGYYGEGQSGSEPDKKERKTKKPWWHRFLTR